MTNSDLWWSAVRGLAVIVVVAWYSLLAVGLLVKVALG